MSYTAQGTGAWLNARVGRLNASRMFDAIDKTKDVVLKDGTIKVGKWAASRANLMKELLAERLTGISMPHYVSPEMKWGIENEPIAKTEFEELTGEIIRPCGYYEHPLIPYFGATPDALRGDGGVIEIKCPKTTTHLQYIMEGVVPEAYRPQILCQLACTGRTHATFISFDPRIAGNKRLFIREWSPGEEAITGIEEAARVFLAEVERMWEILQATEVSA